VIWQYEDQSSTMINSRQLAQIIGPVLSVMTLSEMINLSVWEINIPAVTFLNGVLLFIAGMSIIRVHNFWVRNWTILITLIGWITIMLGLARMFFPTAKQAGENLSTYFLLSVLVVIGLFLVVKGYYPNKNSQDKR
jgi:uncharacterized membrane protein